MPAKKEVIVKSASKNASTSKRLYRSQDERVIAGVAGGLAQYFDLDPIIPRILFVLLTLANGAGLITYLILWVILPKKSAIGGVSEKVMKENVEEIKDKAEEMVGDFRHFADQEGSRFRHLFGWGLLTLGGLLILRRLGILAPGLWGPMVLIVMGLLVLVR